MREKRYDIILWDVDGTLLDFLKSERWALTEAFRDYGFEIDDEVISTYSEINDALWKRLERGEVTKEQVLRGRFEGLFTQLLPGGVLEHKALDEKRLREIGISEFQKKYQHNLGTVYFYLEDSLSLCQKIKSEGFKQYIITNGVEWTQKNKLHLAGFDAVMDDIFISEVIGYNKPHAGFFEGCFKKMTQSNRNAGIIDKSKVLVIGDSMTSDMKGAENAGLDSCLYAPEKAFSEKPDSVTWQIAHLWDVEEILWQNQKDRS